MQQLNLKIHNMDQREKEDIRIVRYSLRVPLEISIEMETAIADQKESNKNKWIVDAIERKLRNERTRDDTLKSLQEKVDKLTEVVMSLKK